MASAEITLSNFGGQHCSVEIHSRDNGSLYATFKSRIGFGYPILEEAELRYVLDLMQRLGCVLNNVPNE